LKAFNKFKNFKVFKIFREFQPLFQQQNMNRQQPFLFEDADPLLRLSEVEEVLRKSRVFRTVPSRPTLIEYCEDGTFESITHRGQHMVYESSLVRFILSFQKPKLKAA
jgi:hypothetical protein